jgi:O-glycosyl hydrolase
MKNYVPNRYTSSSSRGIAFPRLPVALFSFAPLILALSFAASAQTAIDVNGAKGGKQFYGIGAISGGGGNSRLLYDYPSTQQSEILDYLFKPGVGANLQVLKVEIGGGADSTDGSESSVEPTQGAVNCNTGYEWWLMAQAQQRNPNIKFYALAWTAPGWIGGWWNANAINYLVSYLNCAKSHGFAIDYLGGFNEDDGYGNAAWWQQLRSTLDSDGFASTLFVGGDQLTFGIATAILSDSSWAAIMPILGIHYPCLPGNTRTCPIAGDPIASGKVLWQSEGGSADYNAGAPAVIRSITRGYIDGTLVEFTNWPIVAAVYPGLPFDTDGLIVANQPWSGSYSVGATAWVIAQVTQFTQPGWTFINGASGYLNGNEQNGTYVTLKSPDGTDYSTIIETTTATAAQTVKIAVSGGLSTGTVQVWATNLGSGNSADWFVRQPSVAPSGGVYSLTLQPNYVYSITTTSGQGKGASTSPASADLSLPYSDSFGGYATGSEAKYLAQMQGDFQSQPCQGKSGNCIAQMSPDAPSLYFYGVGNPWAVLGDTTWTNYTVSVDALLEQAGTVYLAGRVADAGLVSPESKVPDDFDGYSIQVGNDGEWSLLCDLIGNNSTTLAKGSVAAPGLDAWIALSMTFNGSNVSASVNGEQVASVANSTYPEGQVGIGIGAWQTAQFSNLSVALPNSAAGFTLTPSAATLSVTQGGSATDTVTVTDVNGFAGSVTLAATGLPSGVTATFAANPTNGSSAVTFTAGSAAAAGTYAVTIAGTSGALTETAAIALTVAGRAAPTPITPYLQVNGGTWQASNAASVTLGAVVNLGPQPAGGGTWSWTGPNGFTATTRQIDGIPLTVGANVFTATYTSAAGAIGKEVFTISVAGGCGATSPIVPYIKAGGAWTEESAATVTSSDAAVDLGPQPASGGAWSWTGPNGFSSASREIDDIPLTVGPNVYTATYTVNGCAYTQGFAIAVQ